MATSVRQRLTGLPRERPPRCHGICGRPLQGFLGPYPPKSRSPALPPLFDSYRDWLEGADAIARSPTRFAQPSQGPWADAVAFCFARQPAAGSHQSLQRRTTAHARLQLGADQGPHHSGQEPRESTSQRSTSNHDERHPGRPFGLAPGTTTLSVELHAVAQGTNQYETTTFPCRHPRPSKETRAPSDRPWTGCTARTQQLGSRARQGPSARAASGARCATCHQA